MLCCPLSVLGVLFNQFLFLLGPDQGLPFPRFMRIINDSTLLSSSLNTTCSKVSGRVPWCAFASSSGQCWQARLKGFSGIKFLWHIPHFHRLHHFARCGCVRPTYRKTIRTNLFARSRSLSDQTSGTVPRSTRHCSVSRDLINVALRF